MRRYAAILALLLALLPAAAAAKFDPSFRWSVLETPHFLVHFHQGGEEAARRAAAVAEDVHRRLAPRIRWEPRGRTRLVLADATDDPNGLASPFPYNRIVIYLTPPAGGLGLGLVSQDDWLRYVITHEYAHILQLDMVRGLPSALQYVFGRLYFPNLFQPVWLIEGLAAYEETEQTSGGRGRSPGAEMVLRMAALEGRFPRPGRMAVFPDSWPAGSVPYIFGESFTRHLSETYGREALARASETYSGRWLPFLVDSTARRTYGSGYGELWHDWRRSLTERADAAFTAIAARGLTDSTPLTDRGFITTAPSYAPDGRRIAYAVLQGDEYPGIYIMDSDGRNGRKLLENVFPHSASGAFVAWTPAGDGLVYTRKEIVRNTAEYTDLYLHDLGTGKEFRLTKGLRARDPRVSPDGKRVVFVMTSLGRTRLALLNREAATVGPATEKEVVPVTDWSDLQYESPAWSPDGTRIAVGRGGPGGLRDIVIMDPAGAVLEEVTRDRAIDLAPAWAPDGRTLFFSSDRSGVFNIYAYDRSTQELRQVTNMLGGAFAPSVAPDGASLAFSSYSSRGFDIHRLALEPGAWRPAEPYEERYPVAAYEAQEVPSAVRPYSPRSTIYPRFWLPAVLFTPEDGAMLGALTLNEDAVERHWYLASVFYGPQSHRTWYDLDYVYEGFYPSLRLRVADRDTTHSGFLEDERGRISFVDRSRTAGGAVILPLLRNDRKQWFTLEYQQRRLSALTELPPWPGYAGPLPVEGRLAAVRAGWLLSSTREYAFSFGPEDGRKIEFGMERFDEAVGSELEFTRYTADWREYLGLPWRHHVLLARAFYGGSTGSGPPQGVYELGGDTPGDVTTTLDDALLSLRGYPPNVLRGRKAALATVEYRFPIMNIERGADTAPFFARRLHGAVFWEAGSAWEGEYRSADLRRSAGAELRMNITFSYNLPITLRLVAARGLDEDGETQLYFGFWAPMELW